LYAALPRTDNEGKILLWVPFVGSLRIERVMGRIEIRDFGEFKLIQRIRKRHSKLSDLVLSGIGDDATALHLPSEQPILVTTDILIEDIHFTRKHTLPYFLGAKALAVNLSDIAAMGGIPRFFLLSLGIPKDLSLRFVDYLYEGISHLAESLDVLLVGGDVTAAPKVVLNGVVIGHCPAAQILYRQGAQPGDYIFVTGPLGDSALGLEILRQRGLRPRDFSVRGETKGRDHDLLGLIRHHLAPTPQVLKGRKIAETACASAMIDISDGLLNDLGHIMEESQVGAAVWVDQIPHSRAFEKWASHYHSRPTDLALAGGEDYELLFTAPRDALTDVRSHLRAVDMQVYPIGEVTSSSNKLSLLTKDQRPYVPSHFGYDHFRGPTGKT
jgi:thiamine-monophosphate kinase